MSIIVPADVPKNKIALFKKNYARTASCNGRVFMFAADQKIEHLNTDFYGQGIAATANDPEQLFKLAAQLPMSIFATQLGLIARYARHYPTINFVAKLNSKTNLISAEQEDPISRQLWSVADVVSFINTSKVSIAGVGYTLYLGSIHESIMLNEAAQAIHHAHQAGLIATVWIYPRGRYVKQNTVELVQGAAGVANALGADFVKLAIPNNMTSDDIAIAVQAAGNTGIICAGGTLSAESALIKRITTYIHAGTAGLAIGRNIFQRTTHNAKRITQAIAQILNTQK